MTILPSEDALRALLVEGDKSKGLYELGEALRVLDRSDLGARSTDVERVERFWLSVDMVHASAGFVAVLQNGRRAYLEVWIDHDGAEGTPPDGDVDLTMLTAGQEPLTDKDVEPLGGWIADVDVLNDFLRQQRLPF